MILLSVILACGRPTTAPPSTEVTPSVTPSPSVVPSAAGATTEVSNMIVDAWSPTPAEAGLDWSMSREGDQLTLRYSVENRGQETLWLADRMVATGGGARLESRPVVRSSGRSGTALVAVGLVPPDAPLMHQPAPTYRAVEPGARAEGSYTLSLPLQSWHPHAAVDALGPTSAVIFALDGFWGEPASWKALTATDGTAFQTPVYRTRHWIWSDAKPIP